MGGPEQEAKELRAGGAEEEGRKMEEEAAAAAERVRGGVGGVRGCTGVSRTSGETSIEKWYEILRFCGLTFTQLLQYQRSDNPARGVWLPGGEMLRETEHAKVVKIHSDFTQLLRRR